MSLITKNSKAYYDYTILKKYTCGIILVGSEVKSVKNNNTSINEAFCYIKNGEIFIKGMHISEHKESGKYQNHYPTRERKLLLTKKEIENLNDEVKQKGLTIIPLSIILTDTRLIKIEIGLCRGKKTWDKRESLKEKDLQKQIKANYK